MSAEKKMVGEKRFTIRFEADFYDKLLVAMGNKRVRFIQTAVIKALEQWMTPAALAPTSSDQASTSQTKGDILERLDTLHQGQITILKVLGEITRESHKDQPIAQGADISHALEDDHVARREALRSASKISKAHSESPELPPPAKADRPRKQR